MTIEYKVDYKNKKVVAIGKSDYGKVYRAVAVCRLGDTFDVNVGKKVARLKLMLKQLRLIRANTDEALQENLAKTDQLINRLDKNNEKQRKILEELGTF